MEYELTDAGKSAVIQMYNGLLNNPESEAIEMDMSHYASGDFNSKDAKEICATSACLLGRATLVFPPSDEDYIEESFSFLRYSNRVFDLAKIKDWEDYNILCYLFSTKWEKIDNTLEGALKRTKHLIESDFIPPNWFLAAYITDPDEYSHIELTPIENPYAEASK